MSTGIIAIDEGYDHNNYYYVTDADSSDSEWEAFIAKCNALLKSSYKAHTELVAAAIKYGTTDKKIAERVQFGECIQAFMGEDFDLASLGTWKEVKAHELNRMVIDKDIEQTFVFISNPYIE
jgi:hypothetical protein